MSVKFNKANLLYELSLGFLIALIAIKFYGVNGLVGWSDDPIKYKFDLNLLSVITDDFGGTEILVNISGFPGSVISSISSLFHGKANYLIQRILYALPLSIFVIVVSYIAFKLTRSKVISIFFSIFVLISPYYINHTTNWPSSIFFIAIAYFLLNYGFYLYISSTNKKQGERLIIISQFLFFHPLHYIINLINIYIFLSLTNDVKKSERIGFIVKLTSLSIMFNLWWISPLVYASIENSANQMAMNEVNLNFYTLEAPRHYIALLINSPYLDIYTPFDTIYACFYMSVTILIIYFVRINSLGNIKFNQICLILIFFNLILYSGTPFLILQNILAENSYLYKSLSLFRTYTRFSFPIQIIISFMILIRLKEYYEKSKYYDKK